MENNASELISEINQIRTNPKGYSTKVKQYILKFENKFLNIGNVKIQTNEGAEAYKEAIEFLDVRPPIQQLEPSKGLGIVAREYLKEMQQTEENNIEKIKIDSIIAKQGKFIGNFNRAVDFGGYSPEFAIVSLLVGDGDHSRSQRETLFNTEVNYVGCASGKHQTLGVITVVLTCTKFVNKDGSSDKDPLIRMTTRINQNFKILKSYDVGEEDEDLLPDNVIKVVKKQNIILENSREIQIIKTTKYMKDDSIETIFLKKIIEE